MCNLSSQRLPEIVDFSRNVAELESLSCLFICNVWPRYFKKVASSIERFPDLYGEISYSGETSNETVLPTKNFSGKMEYLFARILPEGSKYHCSILFLSHYYYAAR